VIARRHVRTLAVVGSVVIVASLFLSGAPLDFHVGAAGSTPSGAAPLVGTSSSMSGRVAPAHSRARSPATDAASAPDASAPVLSMAGQTPAAIGLTWTDTATGTFTNYTVQEASLASGWKFQTVTVITTAATTSYAQLGLSPGANYSWQVVEYYETCVLFICTPYTEDSNDLVNATRAAVSFLEDSTPGSSTAALQWTNNATYGSVISPYNYTLWEEVNGSALELVQNFPDQSTNDSTVTLLPDTSYSFLVRTADCTAGCAGTDPTISLTQSNIITLGTFRPLSVVVTVQRAEIDFGEADYFTCTANGGRAPFAYAWNFSTGAFVAGNASESVVLGAVGTENVACRVTDPVPGVNYSSTNVVVNSAMTVVATSNRSASDVGQDVGFSCTISGGTMPYSLTWLYGDGETDTESINTYAYVQAGNYTPACSVSDGAGVTEAPSLVLVVSPAINVTARSSSIAAAPGTALTFTADATNGTGTYTAYSWSFGGGAPVSGAQVSHAFSSTGEITARASVTDSNGATESGSVVVDVSYITVVVTPRVSSSTTGSEVRFTASASGGAGGPYTYSWTFGDGQSASGSSVALWYNSSGKYTPTLTVTDRLGATNTTSLSAITVSPPTAPLDWLSGWVLLAIAVVIGAVIAVFVLSRRRSLEAAELSVATPWVPPTDPDRTIRGRKICPSCGATNLPIRTTCSNCGKPLPRGPS
jgi:chitodextrinase